MSSALVRVPRAIRWLPVVLAPLAVLAAHLSAPSPVLRAVALRTVPWQVVVDRRTARAFVLTADPTANTVSMLDMGTGALLHTAVLGSTRWYQAPTLRFGIAHIAGVDERAQRVFVAGQSADGQGQVSVIDASSGALLRTVLLGPQLGQTGVVAVDEQTGHVFVTGQGIDGQGQVNVLDARSGALLRTVSVGLDPASMAVDSQSGQVLVKGSLRDLAMLDAHTGRLLRTVALAAAGGEVVVDGPISRAFVTDAIGGKVSVLDARSGRILRRITLPLGVGVMRLNERTHHLFVTGPEAAGMTVLDARSGAILRTVGVGAHPVAVAVDGPAGRILVSTLGPTDSAGHVTDLGRVSVLDDRTLAIRGTLTVGAAPDDLAVDERSGHALVVNSNYNPADCSLVYLPPREGWWAPGLRWLARHVPWLPATAPQPPAPPSTGSVILVDSQRV